ncbi:MAG: DUF4397 domain-containing protein [Flavobacterium sp.]|nr:MAG: DUF4397 domain-containing protein [Flavobacterium sp.]
MKINFPALLTISFVLLIICLVTSCIKNENLIKGDTKIRFFNTVGELSQDFYLDGKRVSTGIGYGSNTEYTVFEGDKTYNVLSKNTGTKITSDSISQTFSIGKNYSVFYAKTSATDSVLKVYEDDLTPDTSKSRLFFINVGYTLGSRVSIRNETSSFTKTLGNGETSGYIVLPTGKNSKIYLNLADSTSVIDTISYTNFYKGKTYTILIDGVNKGASKGKLKERLIVNN